MRERVKDSDEYNVVIAHILHTTCMYVLAEEWNIVCSNDGHKIRSLFAHKQFTHSNDLMSMSIIMMITYIKW